MPSIIEFWKFLKTRCHVLESVNQDASTQSSRNQTRANHAINSTGQRAKQALLTSNTKLECIVCKQVHSIYQCEQFQKMDRDTKAAKVKALGLCFNCLKSNYMASECKSGNCRKCKRKHHTLLHIETEQAALNSNNSNMVIECESLSYHNITSYFVNGVGLHTKLSWRFR